MLLKKVCNASTLHLTDYSLNRTAANQIVRGSAEERQRVNSDGALGKMIPQIIIFRYKDYAVKNMREENYRWRRNNFQLRSTFEAAQRTVSRG